MLFPKKHCVTENRIEVFSSISYKYFNDSEIISNCFSEKEDKDERRMSCTLCRIPVGALLLGVHVTVIAKGVVTTKAKLLAYK